MKLTVLGIGNILMRDDGIGVRVMEAVRDSRDWDEEVDFVDGGAGGLGLMPIIESARRLLVLDAADMHLPPGELRVVAPEQVANSSEGRISLHDAPFIETWRLCKQFFTAPPATLLAIQAADVTYGRDLSPALQARMNELVGAAREIVEALLSEPERLRPPAPDNALDQPNQ